MGRMTDQIADDVKTARVEELMLAQQEVAFAKAKSMIGRSIEVLIDRKNDSDTWSARHQGQAPDIDSVVHVSDKSLHAGKLVTVKVIDYQAYDLVAKDPAIAPQKLSVLSH